MFVLKDEVTRYHYENGSTVSEYIMGSDGNFGKLIQRYNRWSGARCKLDSEGRGNYQGDTGGGCSSVTHRLSIKILGEFDDGLN